MSECPHGLFDVCCTNYNSCTLGAPKKEWVGLTDEEMFDCLAQADGEAKRLPLGFKLFAEFIEAKLKEKNT